MRDRSIFDANIPCYYYYNLIDIALEIIIVIGIIITVIMVNI